MSLVLIDVISCSLAIAIVLLLVSLNTGDNGAQEPPPDNVFVEIMIPWQRGLQPRAQVEVVGEPHLVEIDCHQPGTRLCALELPDGLEELGVALSVILPIDGLPTRSADGDSVPDLVFGAIPTIGLSMAPDARGIAVIFWLEPDDTVDAYPVAVTLTDMADPSRRDRREIEARPEAELKVHYGSEVLVTIDDTRVLGSGELR